jgi:hypothetical protein
MGNMLSQSTGQSDAGFKKGRQIIGLEAGEQFAEFSA